jgi:hypothetical protein
MEPGASKLPRPPISGKAQGERPKIPHLAIPSLSAASSRRIVELF